MATKTRPARKKQARQAEKLAMQTVQIIDAGSERKLLLRERLKMTRDVFSRIVDVSPRAIAAAERDQTHVAKLRRPYAEVARLYEALSDVVDEQAIGPWFVLPNQAFGGLKPLELIERGEIDRLWEMVHRLRSGIPG